MHMQLSRHSKAVPLSKRVCATSSDLSGNCDGPERRLISGIKTTTKSRRFDWLCRCYGPVLKVNTPRPGELPDHLREHPSEIDQHLETLWYAFWLHSMLGGVRPVVLFCAEWSSRLNHQLNGFIAMKTSSVDECWSKRIPLGVAQNEHLFWSRTNACNSVS